MFSCHEAPYDHRHPQIVVMSWLDTGATPPHRRAPPAATGFAKLMRRVVMRLRWRWAAL
jgi:hypothetical protein